MKKFFKIFICIFVFVLTICVSAIGVSADTGPHPYTKITFNGNTDGMYVTLLSKEDHNGPFYAYSVEEKNVLNESEKDINQKFIDYKDSDGFYYLQYYKKIERNEFIWSYFPPDTFKILIYDSINDNFITDNKIYEKKEFATMYQVILEPNSQTFQAIKHQQGIGGSIGSFIIRLVICLSIEGLIALAFRFRKKELLIIIGVNIITQILLNVILAIDIYNNGFNMMNILTHAYIPIEIGIIAVEALAYIFIFKKFKFERENNISIKRIIIYTLIANVVSFIGGFAIIAILQNFNIFA